MKQDNKKNFKKIYYLNEDTVYGICYKSIIKAKWIQNDFYVSVIDRMVLNENQKFIWRKEKVLLREIEKLGDNIIILNIVNYEG